MLKRNKGEWLEFYTFVRLLADGKIHYGDENLNIIEDQYFDIDKIVKGKNGADHIFYIEQDSITSDGAEPMSREILQETARTLFNQILLGEKTFSMPKAEELKTILNIERFSAPSYSKADIKLSLVDRVSEQSSIYGFSIKTKLKGKSTLINASGRSTGFRYELKNLKPEHVEVINSIDGGSKINQRISKIIDLGAHIVFDGPTSAVYKSNLKMVDTLLDKIVGELLISAYINNQKILKNAIQVTRFKDFYQNLELDQISVEYKIKNFLNLSAIGMTPSKQWVGKTDVDGGIIVVKSSGDLVGYFIFSLDKFKEYLWQNTYFETPSTSRHNFGYVYEDDGKYYFDLNLQVRFS
jgi:type II restriction enzyme